MARQVRRLSRSGIYHVILRGVNQQRIFEQPEDYEAMARMMENVRTKNTRKEVVEEPNYFLYAYCMMDNHVHMLIQPNGLEPGEVMKRIMMSYAIYFNNKYERVGHLFQDRYKSKVVEDEGYFFTVMRYIMRNPVKAGICKHPSEYMHSSWQELMTVGERMEHPQKTDKEGLSPFVLLCYPELDTNKEIEDEVQRYNKAKKEWDMTKEGKEPKMKSMNLLRISPKWMKEVMIAQEGEGGVYGLFEKVKLMVQGSDTELCQQIRVHLDWQTAEEKDNAIVETLMEMTGVQNMSEFQQLDKETMRTALAIVRESGVGDGVLSRLTGVSRGIIQRAKVYPKSAVAGLVSDMTGKNNVDINVENE